MTSLNWPGAIEDIKNAVAYLHEKGCKKVGINAFNLGIVGFCMGGALSIASCVKVPGVDAGVCYYGIPPVGLADPKDLRKPMQFHFGDKDHSPGFSDIVAADELRDKIKAAGEVDVIETRHVELSPVKKAARSGLLAEFHRYANGDHAFMNEEAPAYPYNAEIAEFAKKLTISFFEDYLS
jgi:carboxymethylenebutenolidase